MAIDSAVAESITTTTTTTTTRIQSYHTTQPLYNGKSSNNKVDGKSVVRGRFGRLWGRGHELLSPESNHVDTDDHHHHHQSSSIHRRRSVFWVSGPGATAYLQNLITSDLYQLPTTPRPEENNATDSSSNNNNNNNIKPTTLASLLEVTPRNSHDDKADDDGMSLLPPPEVQFSPHLRAVCFLDSKGRIVTDALLWTWQKQVPQSPSSSSNNLNDKTFTEDISYLIDVAVDDGSDDLLWKHLHQYKLRRSAITLSNVTDSCTVAVVFGTLSAAPPPPGYLSGLDPRHPALGLRLLKLPPTGTNEVDPNETDASIPSWQQLSQSMSMHFPALPAGNYDLVRRLAGIAEGATELHGKIALEANQEWLHAVHFNKGCYLGQELTARVHHTGVLRKRILPLLLIPPPSPSLPVATAAVESDSAPPLVAMGVPQPWQWATVLQMARAKQQQLPPKDDGSIGASDTPDAIPAKKQQQRQRHRQQQQQHQLRYPPPLPRLSVFTAGHIMALMTGADVHHTLSSSMTTANDDTNNLEKQQQQQQQDVMSDFVMALSTKAVVGARLIDPITKQTVGEIVSSPMPGTNVVTALMRLETVDIIDSNNNNNSTKDRHGGWSYEHSVVNIVLPNNNTKVSKMAIEDGGDHGGGGGGHNNTMLVRYLPYLPLWWPPVDAATGKEAIEEEKMKEELSNNKDDAPEIDMHDGHDDATTPLGYTRIQLETLSLEDDNNSNQNNNKP